MTATSGTPHPDDAARALDLDAVLVTAKHVAGEMAQQIATAKSWNTTYVATDFRLVTHRLAADDVPALVERVRELEARMQRAAAHLHAGGGIGAALRELEGAP